MSAAGDTEVRVQELCTKQSWWKVPHLVKLNIMLLVPFLSSYIGGFDGSMLNGVQTLKHWQEDFDHPVGAMLGLMVNMQVIGGAVSLPLAPYVADKYGRRIAIFIGSIIIIGAALIQGLAINLAMFIIGRFFIGLGGGFVATAAAPLLGELAYPTHRPVFTAIYNTTWYVGAIVAAWSTFGTFKIDNSWSWKIPSLLQALVSVFQLITIFMIPESPRWLIANGRKDEAVQFLCKYHSGTEEPDELVKLQVAEITCAIEFERSLESASYLQFFRTKGNRHRFFIAASLGLIIQWCGNQLMSSYLALVLNDVGITDPETQNLINGGLQIYNFVVATTSATFVDRLGRRFLLLTSTSGMLGAFIIWTILAARNQIQDTGNKGLGIGVVVMVFVFYTFYNFAMNPLPIAYLIEVLPYTLRAKGLSVFNLAQYGSGMFNGFVNPVALRDLRWKYYIVFVCALCLWLAIFYFFYPETQGLTLEEVSRVFDGNEAMERTFDIKAEKFAEGEMVERVVAETKDK